MGAKYKTVRRSWLTEEQGRAFVTACNARLPVRFDGRCWEFVETDDTSTSGGAMTVFRLRLLPGDACKDYE